MNKLLLNFIALLFILSISSCLKDKYDAPPAGGQDPNITVNFSIDSLKARFVGQNYKVTEDLVISAIVVADDKSGNFYKQIAIEDSTGGITLLLESSYIYTSYPIGRRIFIKLKDLYVVQYKGMYQIAGSILPDGTFAGIPTSLWDKYLLKGSYFHDVAPKVVSITQLNDSYQSELIELDDVEFKAADAGQAYADGYNKLSFARFIEDCSGHSVEYYNSGYADFANLLTPIGKGKALAIYGVYNGTPQLMLRQVSDLQLDSSRCGGSIAGPGIANLHNLFSSGTTTVPANTTITGVVISDLTTANITSHALILEDSLAGIEIYFDVANTFTRGTKLSVNVSGSLMTNQYGSLEISGVPIANAISIGSGTVTPRAATIAQIQSNNLAWESTLVTVSNVTISGGTGGTYSGTATLTDGSTNTITLYSKTTATFAGSSYPTASVTVTGYLANHSGVPEIDIRDTNDVQ